MKSQAKKNPTNKPPNIKETAAKNLFQCLQSHRVEKGDKSAQITNTRIGNPELEIYGGRYNIPQEKYPEFLQLYHREVFIKGQPEYLTETQLEKGPLLVDVDFRHDYAITTRQYTQEHIADLVYLYLAVFKTAFQLDDETEIQAYLFQKPTVNRVAEKQITKDGAHLIFSIACDHITQQLIRKKVVAQIEDVWGEDLHITNDWQSVFDEGISQGGTPWQLVGSRKPGHEPYRLTGIFTAKFDSMDEEFSTTFVDTIEDASGFDMAKDIFKLSARYDQHYEPFMTNAFLAEYNQLKEASASGSAAAAAKRALLPRSSTSMAEFDPLSIRSKEQLEACLRCYLDSISAENYHEHEAYAYTMTLPPDYYDSYDKWFKVGCALKTVSKNLFIVWLAFSEQSTKFSFADIPLRWEDWSKFDVKGGLTLRSIIFWSKKDAPEKYKEIRENSIDFYVEQTLDSGLAEFAVSDSKSHGSSDWDIARVLYHLKKEVFVCACVAKNLWYQFKNHRWVAIDSGTTLRVAISTDLRQLYGKKAAQLCEAKATLESEEDPKFKYLTSRIERSLDIYSKLGKTSEKRNIMEAAKEMFYDDAFARTIDTNPHLLCCANGVWDFKEKVFRDGKTEDYISMSTRVDYVPLTEKHAKVKQEIIDFMEKLFPVPELREYMWDHLGSTLVGTALNQTFNNYLGGGRNGKSVLVTLMSKVLGEYKGELPLTAVVTTRRTAVGGLAPEIAGLKGKRYVVMQEPRQGDVLNEGILKELTSGHDAIQARSLFSEPITFLPQFKLVVCANVLPEIKAQDHGTWRRIRVVPFMSLFTEEPVSGDPFKPYQFKLDATIDEKFDTWKTVMLSLLVERVLKTDGRVTDCETVLKASNEYKQKQDVIAQYIDEKIVRAPGEVVKQATIGLDFKNWHELNYGCRGPQAKEVHSYLDRMFGVHDKSGWRDIKLVYNVSDQTEVDEEDATM